MAFATALNGSERDRWTDLAIRAVVISFFWIVGVAYINQIVPLLHGHGIEWAKIASKVLVAACYLMLAWLTFIRSQPVAKARGWQPRISAIMGTNLFMFGLPLVSSHVDLPSWLYAASAALSLVGMLGSICCLSFLGRSFSIMAQARQLVTNGPYRLVRHPLYLVEFIAYLGVLVQSASLIGAFLLIVQCGFQIRRMFNEEALLRTTFPEYAAYMVRTARVIPGVW